MKKLLFSILTFSVSFGFAGPSRNASIHKDVALVWKPTDDINELKKIDASFLENKKITVEKFTDVRKIDSKEKVGENIELKDLHFPVLTKSDISDFVTNNFKLVLNRVGYDFSDEKGDYVLSGEIKEYFVEETDTYNGILSVKLVIKKGGKEVWSGNVTSRKFCYHLLC